MACKYKYNNNWYSKEELQSILYKERGIDKHGKLIKPEIKKQQNQRQDLLNKLDYLKDKEADLFATTDFDTIDDNEVERLRNEIEKVQNQLNNLKSNAGIQPTQTNDTLKESINSIQTKLDSRERALPNKFVYKGKYAGYSGDTWYYKKDGEWYMKNVPFEAPFDTKVEDYNITKMSDVGLGIEEIWDSYLKSNPEGVEDLKVEDKEYTSQALINTKIAALKEVAKKYPRSLIRSEVKPISQARQPLSYFEDDIPFQKLPSLEQKINKNKC